MMTDREGQGDFGLQSVKRGKDAEYLENSEYAIVLPDVDKVAVLALGVVELAAVVVQSPVWSAELHLATVGAIAGLGGYSLNARRAENAQRQESTEDGGG